MHPFTRAALFAGVVSLVAGLHAIGCGGGDSASSTGTTASSAGTGGAAASSSGQGGIGTSGSSSGSGTGTAGASGTGGSSATSGSGSGTGGSGTGGSGTGGGGTCQDGDTQPCYSGDPGTEDVGICVGGLATCASGMFGPCEGEVLPTSEACNGTDDNCDGTVDDGCPCTDGATQTCYSGPANTAGQGECKAGTQTCSSGSWGPCTGEITPASETCDSKDNDCNGQTDDGIASITCGTGACVTTVLGCVGGMVPTCTPGQPSAEVCNGIDDDCNLFIDDGLGTLPCGIGECAVMAPACVNGQPGACMPGQPSPEVCDGKDNDCDGATDEGNPGGGSTCTTGQPGVCAAGTTTCSGGAITCTPSTPPSTELCDGKDNNCDGQTDEGNPGGGQTCNTGQLGVCATGTSSCSGGTITCTPTTTPSPETCDGKDNNCNGAADEGNPGGGGNCTTGQPGICSAGTLFCVGGQLSCTQNSQPSPETCDGKDNNCNGQTDEGNPGGGGMCTTGQPGVCSAGTLQCQSGSLNCVQTTQPSAETCDGKDNNCNGQTDEGNPGGGGMCTTGLPGVCSAGTLQCQNGSLTCAQTTSSSAEICDSKDNDCDGMTDEGNPGGGGACTTGQPGVCSAGTLQCQSGSLNCVQTTPPSTEICDNKDNNCNGQTDEGNPGGGGACNTGQPGVCSAGTMQCQSGTLSCQPTTPPSSEICDNKDNNCNGQTDEGNPGGGVACNTGLPGVCSAGTTQCQSGSLNCVQSVFPSTEICDNKDNDCDGATDEGNPGGGAACNTGLQGVCAAGTITCAGGALTCQQNVGPSSELCSDMLDNDCDGVVNDGCPVGCSHDKCTAGVALVSGCDACVTQVCAADAFCCDSLMGSWDTVCVAEVDSICKVPCACSHSMCVTGSALVSTCNACVTAICAQDSFCCSSSWDSFCVGEVNSICGLTCT